MLTNGTAPYRHFIASEKKNRKGHARRRQSLATERARSVTLHLQAGAREVYPNKPATRHCSTRPTECIPCLRRHPALLYCVIWLSKSANHPYTLIFRK